MKRQPKTVRVAKFYPYHSRRHMDVAKREADSAVQRALHIGLMKRQPCIHCGAKAEAHHDDYQKPLDVMWLCRYHHRHRDADLRDMRRGELRLARSPKLPVAALRRHKARRAKDAAIVLPPKRTYQSRTLCDSAHMLVRQTTLNVAEALDLMGISESALARRVKTSRQAVNQHFAGGFRSLKLLAAYADVLDCDAWFVLRPRNIQRVAS